MLEQSRQDGGHYKAKTEEKKLGFSIWGKRKTKDGTTKRILRRLADANPTYIKKLIHHFKFKT